MNGMIVEQIALFIGVTIGCIVLGNLLATLTIELLIKRRPKQCSHCRGERIVDFSPEPVIERCEHCRNEAD